jgi:hypothetical protein
VLYLINHRSGDDFSRGYRLFGPCADRQPSHEVQDLIEGLTGYLSIDSIPEKKGWSKVECSSDGTSALHDIRNEFMKEFNGSKVMVHHSIKT